MSDIHAVGSYSDLNHVVTAQGLSLCYLWHCFDGTEIISMCYIILERARAASWETEVQIIWINLQDLREVKIWHIYIYIYIYHYDMSLWNLVGNAIILFAATGLIKLNVPAYTYIQALALLARDWDFLCPRTPVHCNNKPSKTGLAPVNTLTTHCLLCQNLINQLL